MGCILYIINEVIYRLLSTENFYDKAETQMNSKIKIIEDLSLNAWPSHQMQIYDGWILRFSYFYTHRTNCVEQIGPSSIPLRDKIAYCEEVYAKWGTPTIFKINPLMDSSFDQKLMERGYHTAHTTEVMTLDLEKYKIQKPPRPVFLSREISPDWLNGLFSLKGTVNEIHRKIVPSMYRAIPKDTIFASIYDGGRIIGTGLGILDRDYVGIYAIHVAEEYRRQHLGESICRSILNSAIDEGATEGYLQVVEGNVGARRLYEGLGFEGFYTYWFRQEF